MDSYYSRNKEVIIEKRKQKYLENKEKFLEEKKQYYLENKEKILEKRKQYYLENMEKIKNKNNKWWSKNKETGKKINKQRYLENKEKILEKQKQYYLENKEKILEKQKQYYLENRETKEAKPHKTEEEVKESRKRYYLNNKLKLAKKCNERHKKRYANDHLYKLKHCIKASFNRAIKVKKTEEILGCSYEQFKKYIEKLWLPGMTWDNYCIDGWHIDHKTPLSWFDLDNPNEVAKANHYSNLQPMWAKDNFSKNNRFSSGNDK